MAGELKDRVEESSVQKSKQKTLRKRTASEPPDAGKQASAPVKRKAGLLGDKSNAQTSRPVKNVPRLQSLPASSRPAAAKSKLGVYSDHPAQQKAKPADDEQTNETSSSLRSARLGS